MLCLLVFLQVCHFLTAFPKDASVKVCGANLQAMIALVCKNRFETSVKKRSETTIDDNSSFKDVEEMPQRLEHDNYRTPDVPSKIRLADILSPYLSTSNDNTFFETTYGGLPHQRFRRDTEYVVYGNLANDCCHKSCKISYMELYCARN